MNSVPYTWNDIRLKNAGMRIVLLIKKKNT